MAEWQHRPLDRVYPVIFIDAIVVKVRDGELTGLRWSVVDLDVGSIAIERAITQLGKQLVATTPKNHERRTVGIDDQTVAVLRMWKAQQAAERLAFGPTYADVDGLVFVWPDGRPMMPDYITKSFATHQATINAKLAAAEEKPLPRLVVHELRHTHATLLLREGVPVHVVAKRLSHKDPSVTLNVYADVIPDNDTSAVDVFGRWCGEHDRWRDHEIHRGGPLGIQPDRLIREALRGWTVDRREERFSDEEFDELRRLRLALATKEPRG